MHNQIMLLLTWPEPSPSNTTTRARVDALRIGVGWDSGMEDWTGQLQ